MKLCNMLNTPSPETLLDTECGNPAVKRVKADPESLLCGACVVWWEADGGLGELVPIVDEPA